MAAFSVDRGLNLVVADDAALFGEALSLLLQRAGHTVTLVDNAEDLLAAVDDQRPDLAIVDVRMPPDYHLEGIRAALRIRRDYGQVAVLLLSQAVEVSHLDRILDRGTGGVGYLLKERVTGASEFIDYVQRVARGGTAVDPEVVDVMLTDRATTTGIGRLSPGEYDVLRLMAEGRSNQSIGDKLYISPKTVERRITSIFLRLGLGGDQDENRRVMAVIAYLRADRRRLAPPLPDTW